MPAKSPKNELHQEVTELIELSSRRHDLVHFDISNISGHRHVLLDGNTKDFDHYMAGKP